MEQAITLSRSGFFHLSLLWLFNVSATGSYHSVARYFSRTAQFSVHPEQHNSACTREARRNNYENSRILSLRGGVEGKEGSTLPFGGPNPKDEFDASDEDTAAQPKSDTIYVPLDFKSVPEAVEVSSMHE
jgi:hypothetical protein